MKNTHLIVAGLLGLMLGACTLAKAPVGSVKEKLNAQDWDGDWVNEDDEFGGDTIHIQVKDADKGILQASRGKSGGSDGADIYVRKLGEWDIASIRFDKVNPDTAKTGDGNLYVFMRLQRVGKNIIVAVSPKHELMKRLIEEHSLKGSVLMNKDGKPSESYVLDELPESAVALLKEASGGNPFESDKIVYVFKRRK